MAFWNRRSVDTGTDDEVYRAPGRHWPALLVLLLIALIIATGVVYAGRWAYRKATTPTNPVPVISQKTETKSSTQKTAQHKSSISTSNSTSSNGSISSKSSQSSNLPNSGPSNVVMLFLGSAFAATALHYAVILKRNS